MTQDALEARRESLGELENSEREAKRPDDTQPTSPDAADEIGAKMQTGEEGLEQDENPASVFLPPHPGPSPVKRRAPGMGLLSALSYTIHGMMDADPESARRSGISKTRETISQVSAHSIPIIITAKSHARFQLEDALHLSAQDLKYASSTIQADLDRFQRQKVADLREMAISMARSHREWCKKVCTAVLLK
jgi:hypothetical protein